jgi:tetratricopeptide (TPR) repeat protein
MSDNKRKDHIIILGILAAVVLLYIGYEALTPDAVIPVENEHQHGTSGMLPDMGAFVQSLPTDYNSLVSMGNALMDQGQYAMAVECYSRALNQKPEVVDVRVDLGTCQHSLGLNREAIENFTKALEYDPSHAIAKFNLGIVHYSLEEFDQAIEWWQRLLAENPPQKLKEQTEALIQQMQDY